MVRAWALAAGVSVPSPLRVATAGEVFRVAWCDIAEGSQVLAEIYGRFTEGFDTSDLQDAEALLEELRKE
jgi:hypothetical protein